MRMAPCSRSMASCLYAASSSGRQSSPTLSGATSAGQLTPLRESGPLTSALLSPVAQSRTWSMRCCERRNESATGSKKSKGVRRERGGEEGGGGGADVLPAAGAAVRWLTAHGKIRQRFSACTAQTRAERTRVEW